MKAIDEAKKNCKKVIEDLEALDKSSTSATNKTSIANSKTKISKAIEGLDKVHGFYALKLNDLRLFYVYLPQQ